MSNFLETITGIIFYFIPLIVVGMVVIVVSMRRERRHRGRKGLALIGLPILCVGSFFYLGHSWRLIPTVITGHYRYHADETPDPKLISTPPEDLAIHALDLIIESRETVYGSVLTGYELGEVDIIYPGRDNAPHKESVPYAYIDVTLHFENGQKLEKEIEYQASDALITAMWWFKTTKRIDKWTTSMAHHQHIVFVNEITSSSASFTGITVDPFPASAVQTTPPPIQFQLESAIDVREGQSFEYVQLSDIGRNGDLIYQIQSAWGFDNINQTILHTEDGQRTVLLEEDSNYGGWGVFSPDETEIAYKMGSGGFAPAQLIVYERESGRQTTIGEMDWMTHHWVGDDQIMFSQNEEIVVQEIGGDRQPLRDYPTGDYTSRNRFSPSPTGKHLMYMSDDQTIRMLNTEMDEDQPIGWQLGAYKTSELTAAWNPVGDQAVFTDNERQVTLKLWTAATGEVIDLFYLEPHKEISSRPEDREIDNLNFTTPCWLTSNLVFVAVTSLVAPTYTRYRHTTNYPLVIDVTTGAAWEIDNVELRDSYQRPNSDYYGWGTVINEQEQVQCGNGYLGVVGMRGDSKIKLYRYE